MTSAPSVWAAHGSAMRRNWRNQRHRSFTRVPSSQRRCVLPLRPVQEPDHSRPELGAGGHLRALRPKKVLPLLQGDGRFTRAKLETLIWSSYTPEEQRVFLSMMESCGICFKARELSDEEWEYIAPELLPTWPEAQKSLLTGRIPKDHPVAEAEASYRFLHEGVLRSYLSKIGQQAGDAAQY